MIGLKHRIIPKEYKPKAKSKDDDILDTLLVHFRRKG